MLTAFDRWQARGVSIVGFVHAGHNHFADASRPLVAFGDVVEEHHGLSPLGRVAVARLNDLGILIDVSQLSDAAFTQVVALSRAPVIASHSDVRALVDVPRNLSDAQLDLLARHGGVVAINAFSVYLRPRTSATLRALDALRAEFVRLQPWRRHRRLGRCWRDARRDGGAEARGYTVAAIAKLQGGNVLRVWQAALDAANSHR